MKLNYGKILMFSAILVAMPRWAGAFISADVAEIPSLVNEALHYANLIAGFGMGFLEVLAAAYMLDAWGKMKPKKTWNAKSYDHKWKVLTGFIIGLFIMMPLILSPYIVSRMTGETVASALGGAFFRYAWSFAVVLSPIFIVGGVAVANGELVTNEMVDTAGTKPVAQPRLQPTGQPKRNVPQPVAPEVAQPEGTRALVYEAYQEKPRATQQEIADFLAEQHGVEISRQMVGKHKRALNGAMKNGRSMV